MYQIRPNVFETNSSSTHSLNICTKEEFESWENNPDICFIGNAWGNFDSGNFDGRNFVTKEEINQRAQKANEEDGRYDYPKDMFVTESSWDDTPAQEENILTYEAWHEQEYLETYAQHFTTPSGDEMVVFGEYGQEY